jgi:hypothetical protein
MLGILGDEGFVIEERLTSPKSIPDIHFRASRFHIVAEIV